MDIHYQDKNLIVMYLQIFLRENMGAVVHKVTPRSKSIKPYYEISSNDIIKVTGYWTPQSYTALALYMAYNYPNEGFPYKWTRQEGVNDITWESEDYIYDGGDTTELVKIIGDNLDNYAYAKASSTKSEQYDLLYVPGRILSYIFKEVVTPKSSPSEVFRVKTMMYPTIYANESNKYPLSYDENLFNDIVKIQQDWIDRYTLSWNKTIDEYTVVKGKNETFVEVKEVTLKPRLSQVTPMIYGEVLLSQNDSSRLVNRYYEFVSNSSSLSLKLPSTQVDKIVIQGIDSSGASSKVTIVREEGADSINYNKSLNRTVVDLGRKFSELNSVEVSYKIESKYTIPTGKLVFNEVFSSTSDLKIYLEKISYSSLNLTDDFKGFKVTGYVDPWTEKLIKRERGEIDVGSNIVDNLRKS